MEIIMKRFLSVVLLFCICGSFLCSCVQEKNKMKDVSLKNNTKYLVNAEFDSENKRTIYRGLDYFGYEDFLEYIYSAEAYGIEGLKYTAEIDLNHDVDPQYIRANTVDDEAIGYDYYKNFQKNLRKAGDYLISDFKDGVCINRYLFDEKKYRGKKEITIDIPKSINGKKVRKLSGFIVEVKGGSGSEHFQQVCFFYNIGRNYKVNINIPDTVTEISDSVFCCGTSLSDGEGVYFERRCAELNNIEVAADNPRFCAENGFLYSKNKEWLLYISAPELKKNIYLLDRVKYIAYINGLTDYNKTITVGKNVKKIYLERFGAKMRARVYKDSYSDKYLRKCGVKRIEYI